MLRENKWGKKENPMQSVAQAALKTRAWTDSSFCRMTGRSGLYIKVNKGTFPTQSSSVRRGAAYLNNVEQEAAADLLLQDVALGSTETSLQGVIMSNLRVHMLV